jgi:hypothetical protein
MSRVPSSVARLFSPRTLIHIPNTAATCLGVAINPFAACFAFLINPCGSSFHATVREEFNAAHPHSQHRVHQTGTDLKYIDMLRSLQNGKCVGQTVQHNRI